MVRLSGTQLRSRAAGIRLVVSDVDGVLTDAGVYYSADGEELKRFSMRDGMGVELLRRAGIRTALMTRENSPIVSARAKKLSIENVWSAQLDKGTALPRLAAELGHGADAVAYIGDDVNDLGALAWVAEQGLAVCPADAVTKVREAAHFVTAARGGHGAFRELCDLILDHRQEHNS
ncbi:MAG TPA: HAD hydrolase family protein [Polyangiaceae bacterium]|nr:HAD hydrolase family protein [Polyangiaceae bacterium]